MWRSVPGRARLAPGRAPRALPTLCEGHRATGSSPEPLSLHFLQQRGRPVGCSATPWATGVRASCHGPPSTPLGTTLQGGDRRHRHQPDATFPEPPPDAQNLRRCARPPGTVPDSDGVLRASATGGQKHPPAGAVRKGRIVAPSSSSAGSRCPLRAPPPQVALLSPSLRLEQAPGSSKEARPGPGERPRRTCEAAIRTQEGGSRKLMFGT